MLFMFDKWCEKVQRETENWVKTQVKSVYISKPAREGVQNRQYRQIYELGNWDFISDERQHVYLLVNSFSRRKNQTTGSKVKNGRGQYGKNDSKYINSRKNQYFRQRF